MTELPRLDWPPLIVGATVPNWTRVRDFVLTLVAWLLLFWAIRYGLELVADYLRPPVFEFSRMEPPNWNELGRRLQPFLKFIAILLIWLLCWALVRGRAMRIAGGSAQPNPLHLPPPQPLPLHEHAASFGHEAHELDAWRSARVTVVHFTEDGQMLRAEVRQAM